MLASFVFEKIIVLSSSLVGVEDDMLVIEVDVEEFSSDWEVVDGSRRYAFICLRARDLRSYKKRPPIEMRIPRPFTGERRSLK